MKRIPFTKYTSCGNNFVIVDATKNKVLAESEMSGFARKATNSAFGIGCDNLLVIQRCDTDTLGAIAAEHGYWDVIPDATQAAFIFRMFEPTGEEALCCGNGLICIADHLYRHHGIEKASVMTEIPFSTPSIRIIGRATAGDGCWADMGHPRRIPASLMEPGTAFPLGATIDAIGELTIPFQPHELKPYTGASSLTLSGYLVFTGEPHLVVFPDLDFSIPALAAAIFSSEADRQTGVPSCYHQGNFGSWLVHRIGDYINGQCQHLFPAGLNINFARPLGAGMVENRCFERGINRETLACGTGALAVAYVDQHVYGIETAATDVLPLRCRWHDPEALIRVQDTGSGWLLNTRPILLFEGLYQLEPHTAQARPVRDYRSLHAVANASHREERLAVSLPLSLL